MDYTESSFSVLGTDSSPDVNDPSQQSMDQSFFKKLETDFESGALGWIGDFKDFALGYLTFASTLLARVPNTHARPVGSVVIGETSTGKTELANSLMRLFSEDHVICVTSLSAKSLIYRCLEDPHCLNGKIIFVEELSGLRNEDLQYLLRVLVTRGEVKHATVINGKPVEIKAKGFISLQTTGLPTDRLRDDTMNRLITIYSDSSPQMTNRVIHEIKKSYASYGHSAAKQAHSINWYKRFYSQLRPYQVVVPFAEDLPLSGSEPESRRMSKIIMDLVCTVALINQKDRVIENGFLIAEREDFDIVSGFLKVAKKSHNLSSRDKTVFDAIQQLPNTLSFTYDDVISMKPGDGSAVDGGYSLTSVKYALASLVDAGVVKEIGRRNRVMHFCLS
jgi:hypothetical protein